MRIQQKDRLVSTSRPILGSIRAHEINTSSQVSLHNEEIDQQQLSLCYGPRGYPAGCICQHAVLHASSVISSVVQIACAAAVISSQLTQSANGRRRQTSGVTYGSEACTSDRRRLASRSSGGKFAGRLLVLVCPSSCEPLRLEKQW